MKNLVSTDWLEKNLNNVRIFDGSWHLPNANRDALSEFNLFHIENASFFDIDKYSDHKSNLPHMLPSKDIWEKIMSDLGVKNSDHIIVYDDSDVFSSCRVWFTFLYFGHDSNLVSVLDGGLKKWLKEKKFTTSKINKILPTKNYKTIEKSFLIKSKKEIEENISKKYFILVDGRSIDRFQGKVEEPRPGLKKGCIPNSKNIPFENCINIKTNTFKNKLELIRVFKENDVNYFKPNVFSCGSGVTACVLGLAYFIISDKNAVIYDGSYSEWGEINEKI